MKNSDPSFVQITTTAGSREEADRIATTLVDRRLAGCVQILGPVRSVYRWQGKIEHSEEWLCQIKTTREQYAAVEAAIRELHSYDCPEIIATPIVAGSEAYLQWLAEQIAAPGFAGGVALCGTTPTDIVTDPPAEPGAE